MIFRKRLILSTSGLFVPSQMLEGTLDPLHQNFPTKLGMLFLRVLPALSKIYPIRSVLIFVVSYPALWSPSLPS